MTQESDEDPYKERAQGPACLNELSSWLHELLKRGCPRSIYLGNDELSIDKIYAKAILGENSPELIAIELQTILPDTPKVRAILPVLVTGYIMKRREAPKEPDPQFPNGATSFYKAITYGGEDISRYKGTSDIIRPIPQERKVVK